MSGARGCSRWVSVSETLSSRRSKLYKKKKNKKEEEEDKITVKQHRAERIRARQAKVRVFSAIFFPLFPYFLPRPVFPTLPAAIPESPLLVARQGRSVTILTRMVFAERTTALRVEALALEVLLAHLQRNGEMDERFFSNQPAERMSKVDTERMPNG